MNALEALQGADRSGGNSGVGEIKLDDLVARDDARVLDFYACSHLPVGRDRGLVDGGFPIPERCVAEAVAEWVEGLTAEVAVSTFRHRVVVESRQLSGGFIKRNRQAPGRAEVASQESGDCRAAFFTGIPGFD